MSLPVLLAQAAPVVIAQDTAFSWPVFLVALGFAAGLGETRWRMSRVEKDFEASEKARLDLDRRLATAEQQSAVMASTLGRIEKGQENMERMLREALATRAS